MELERRIYKVQCFLWEINVVKSSEAIRYTKRWVNN